MKVVHFSEDQPRVPAGTEKGGQWTSADKMMSEFYKISYPHPFDRTQRLIGNVGVGLAKHEGNVLLQFITSYEKKNAGQASSALNKVLELADRNMVTMKLDVHPLTNAGAREGKNLGRKALHDWYARRGFKGGDSMTRKPAGTKTFGDLLSGLTVAPKVKKP